MISIAIRKKLAYIKANQKIVAAEIRSMKNQRKGAPDGAVDGLTEWRYDYRVTHIAYCLMRGRKLWEIERSRLSVEPSAAADKYLSARVSHEISQTYGERVKGWSQSCRCRKCAQLSMSNIPQGDFALTQDDRKSLHETVRAS